MVLLTGATGMVGQHLLASLLKSEQKIRAIYRTQKKIAQTKKRLCGLWKIPEKAFDKVEWIKADLADISQLTDAFDGVVEIYHCAGLVSYDVRDYQKLRKTNIEGTANMVNLALKFKVKKFCHLSSVAAFGSEINGKSITEKSPRDNEAPHSNYSISKFGAEMEVWRASQEGLSVVIVNPGIIIGSGNWTSGSGQLFDRVAKGFRYKLPIQTGFVAVADVVSAMQKLMKSQIENEGFILVGENLSFAEVTAQIAEILDKPKPKKKLKRWMVVLGWVFQSLGNALFNTKKEITRQSISDVFGKTSYDHSKICGALNFHFTPIPEALEKTGKAYLQEH